MASNTNQPVEKSGISGFFKKHIFDTGEPQDAAPLAPTAPRLTPGMAPGSSTKIVAAQSYDTAMMEALQKTISTKPTAYTSLLESAEAMADAIPDESTRLRAAASMLIKREGRSPSEFAKALDIHMNDVEQERRRFKQTVENRILATSGASRKEAAGLNDKNMLNAQRVAQLREQIQQLETESAANQQRANELTAQADAAEQEDRAIEARFDATADYLKNDLNNRKASLAALLS